MEEIGTGIELICLASMPQWIFKGDLHGQHARRSLWDLEFLLSVHEVFHWYDVDFGREDGALNDRHTVDEIQDHLFESVSECAEIWFW